MGEVYFYVNLDRREHFSIGLGFQSNKHSGIGRNLGARALGLLLLGTWGGNRIAIIGDEATDGRYETLQQESRDITSRAVLMLFRDDERGLLGEAATHSSLLAMLGEFAAVFKIEAVREALDRRFGAEWRKVHGRLRRESWRPILPPD
jgi:hypothetical protein